MKKTLVIIATLLVVCLLAVGLVGCNKTSDWEYIEEKGTMIIGWTPNPPIAITDDNDATKLDKNMPGFDSEFALAVGEALGVKVEFRLISWKMKDSELQTRNIDLIWNGLTVTEERKAAYELSVDYLYNNQVAVIRKEDATKYNSVATLKTANKFVAEDGSAGADVFDELFKTSDKDTVKLLKAQINALNDVKLKGSDVALVDRTMAEYYCSKNSDCMVASDSNGSPILLNETETYAVAARKGDTVFIGKVNDAIRTLVKNGKYDELLNKYGLTNLKMNIATE